MFFKKDVKLSLPLSSSLSHKSVDFHTSHKGFTLIELLIVIGILAVLATVTLLVINPAQMFAESRDASRISDMDTINKALLYYQGVGGINLGLPNKVYISIPSSYADCGYSESNPLALPALGTGYVYVCSDQTHYRNADGTGWIPVDFTSTQGILGALLTSLPVDPINTPNGLYYTYISGSWALSATLESDKYITTIAANDGGKSATRFEVGNEIALDSNLIPAIWVCGNTLTDSRNSKTYPTVLIGTQCWMATNMDYDNGCSTKTWVNSTDVGWCGYYNGVIYPNEGLLYQWSAAMNGSTTAGAQGICPTGWHIPTHDELTTLERAVCTSTTCATDFPYDTTTAAVCRGTNEGGSLKEIGTTHWASPNTGATNTSGFTGLPPGYRDAGVGFFYGRASYMDIWSSVVRVSGAWERGLFDTQACVLRTSLDKPNGLSVRCLKD